MIFTDYQKFYFYLIAANPSTNIFIPWNALITVTIDYFNFNGSAKLDVYHGSGNYLDPRHYILQGSILPGSNMIQLSGCGVIKTPRNITISISGSYPEMAGHIHAFRLPQI